MISAMDFTNPLVRDSRIRPGFGISREATADSLRRIANAIERGEIFVNSARCTGLAQSEDFAVTSLRLVLHETYPKQSGAGG